MDIKTKLLIVDDHPSFIEGVSHLLQSIFNECDIFTTNNGHEALAIIKKHPDMDWVFLDLNMPDMSGIELITHLEKNKITANVIIMTSESSPDVIDQSLKKHVNAFLTKDFDRKMLLDCVSTVESGRIFLTPQNKIQLHNYRESVLREKQEIEDHISQRQQETLLLIAKGFSNHQIATNLGISENTVKSHVSSLMSLFEADNRTHCVAEARRLHIVD